MSQLKGSSSTALPEHTSWESPPPGLGYVAAFFSGSVSFSTQMCFLQGILSFIKSINLMVSLFLWSIASNDSPSVFTMNLFCSSFECVHHGVDNFFHCFLRVYIPCWCCATAYLWLLQRNSLGYVFDTVLFNEDRFTISLLKICEAFSTSSWNDKGASLIPESVLSLLFFVI